jgi:2-methylisocitrate lyase-like PEP mutase family enzyme
MARDSQKLSSLADRFLVLHQGPRILLLPNAWDAGSARLYEEAGFPAIGTTSAGIAFSRGLPDGERIAFREMIAAISRIAASVQIPVTADIEAGFGPTPEATAESCRAVLQAGAVGINLEDGSRDITRPLVDRALHSEKVRAAREAAAREKIHLVINARTDVFLRAVGEPGTRLDEALARINAYREAGADCLFVPGVSDAETIGKLVQGAGGPVNILGGPGAPSVGDLERLGVRRVSLGSGPMRSGLGLLRRMIAELQGPGTWQALEGAIPYAELNKLFGRGLSS